MARQAERISKAVGQPPMQGPIPRDTAPLPPFDLTPHRRKNHTGRNLVVSGVVLSIAGATIIDKAATGHFPWENQGIITPNETLNPSNSFELPSPTPGETIIVTFPPTFVPPSHEPSPSPIQTGYSEQNGNIIYTTEKGEVLNVPQIPGLRAERQDQKVVYVALKDNPYGMKEGQYGGIYKPNVLVDQDNLETQTGGVALKAPVVKKLISERLNSITEVNKKYTAVMPVDITSLSNDKNVKIKTNSITGYNDELVPLIRLEFEGILPAVNIIPNSTHINFAFNSEGWWQYDDLDLSVVAYRPGHAIEGAEIMGNFPKIKSGKSFDSKFGNTVTSADGWVQFFLNRFPQQPAVPLEIDDLLNIQGAPVFLAAN